MEAVGSFTGLAAIWEINIEKIRISSSSRLGTRRN
jgi:hypothetical protein